MNCYKIILFIVWFTAGLSCNSTTIEIEEDNNEINQPENESNKTDLPFGAWGIIKFGYSIDGNTFLPVEFERLQVYYDENGEIKDVSHLPFGYMVFNPLICDSMQTTCSPDSLSKYDNKEIITVFTLYQQNTFRFEGWISGNQITITGFGQITLAMPTEEDLYFYDMLKNVHSFKFIDDEIILYFKEINNINLMILRKSE